MITNCAYCNKEMETIRVTKKVCSVSCEQKLRKNSPKERNCRHCGKTFSVIQKADANRQHCSKQCAKNHNSKRVSEWVDEHPGSMVEYKKTFAAKNPGFWKEKSRADRDAALELLGKVCIVCGASNRNWLHIDYIPTTRGKTFRHPRHLKFIKEHLNDFRILCANHHYELTLTGAIEGTEITQ